MIRSLKIQVNKFSIYTLVGSFLEKQERIIRENRFHRNKSYTNLIPGRNGVGIKSIQPVFNKALDEAILEAGPINVDQGDNKLKEESMKQQLKTYNNSELEPCKQQRRHWMMMILNEDYFWKMNGINSVKRIGLIL